MKIAVPITNIGTIHSLRHTNITLQILSGVPLVTVAGRAGHSRTSTTSDIYSHYIQTSDAWAAEKLDRAFSAKKVEKPKTSDIDDCLSIKKKALVLKEWINWCLKMV